MGDEVLEADALQGGEGWEELGEVEVDVQRVDEQLRGIRGQALHFSALAYKEVKKLAGSEDAVMLLSVFSSAWARGAMMRYFFLCTCCVCVCEKGCACACARVRVSVRVCVCACACTRARARGNAPFACQVQKSSCVPSFLSHNRMCARSTRQEHFSSIFLIPALGSAVLSEGMGKRETETGTERVLLGFAAVGRERD